VVAAIRPYFALKETHMIFSSPRWFLLFALLLIPMLLIACADDDDDNDDNAGDDDTLDDDDTSVDDDTIDDDDDTTDDDDDTIDDDDDTEDDDTGDDDTGDDDITPIDCPAVITRQPYLQLATQTGIHVLWLSDQKGDSLIEWGETEDLGEYVYDESFTAKHELAIEGLEPATEYFYKVRTCLDETTVASFRTAPQPGTPFNFVGFGDNQSGWETFTDIAALMYEKNPWLAMSVGDCVDDGWNFEDFEQQLFGPGEDLWREAPLYVSIGNHEGLAPNFFDAFHFPNDDKAYYSFTWGNVFFLCLALDTWHIAIPGTPQYKYMVQELSSDAAQNADFRVVFFHTPPWTEGWDSYDGEWYVRMFTVPVMEQHNVDVYFNGHTHDYERGLRNGVASYIIGGAGGGLDSWARDVEHITVYEAVHHFVNVSVDDATMRIDAIDLDGNIFDTYTISK